MPDVVLSYTREDQTTAQRFAQAEISCDLTAKLVRGLYCGSKAADDYVDIARMIWAEAFSEAHPP